MSDITIATVLSKIKDDLNWRGPNDRTMGHIVLSRADAEYLHQWVIKMCLAKDNLEYELDKSRALVADKREEREEQREADI